MCFLWYACSTAAAGVRGGGGGGGERGEEGGRGGVEWRGGGRGEEGGGGEEGRGGRGGYCDDQNIMSSMSSQSIEIANISIPTRYQIRTCPHSLYIEVEGYDARI